MASADGDLDRLRGVREIEISICHLVVASLEQVQELVEVVAVVVAIESDIEITAAPSAAPLW